MKKIAIIGAGPYGLIALDRLIKRASPTEKTEILLFDPFGPGGNVWRENQSDQVIMNTVMQHVTLFSEDEGPNLAEWSRTEAAKYLAALGYGEDFSAAASLGENDYCQRRYYGIYQRWFFEERLKQLSDTITVELITEKVSDMTITEKAISLEASKTYQVGYVILATGHSSNNPNEEEIQNQQFADAHGLFYQGPINPSDAQLDSLREDDVILRGLGLSFFDYIALFVAKWGGQFYEKHDRLVYQRSGKERRLIVGSGRGLPYHARPDNQKKPGEEAVPQILTELFMKQFKGGAEDLFDLLRKEAELVYYQKKLANNKIDLPGFLRDYREGDRESILSKYRIPVAERLDWETLLDPARKTTPQEFPDFIQTYLKKDIAEAELGNQTGAAAAAIDTYKELQEPFNYMLDQEKFSPKDYYEKFWGTFNRTYSFLTIGAPAIRQKQLLALVEAGLVIFLAPEMVIERGAGSFLTFSRREPERSFHANNLIEARLPATNLEQTQNPLLIQMKEKGYIASHILHFDGSEHRTGALKVCRKTHQVIDHEGAVLPHVFCYGVPLEGLDWLNAASPRPKNRDRIFHLANQIVDTIYR